ncbi:unnamed protein product [Prorocentrum cordatum]|uniref:Uncharacterized protein n=1 Tax=Prorocentrum cordatum TaxID=2364126 RepID=A0ABN9SMD5_9DINO|nr:unnamed protein product [Polarella glacialis]
MDAGAGALGEANATGLLASLLNENSDLQTQLVWLVRRTVLPILLFVLWFRNQSKSDDTKYRYTRNTVLAARKAVDADEVPESLSNLKLLDEASVQKALGGPPPRARGSADAGARSGAGARPKRAPADKARAVDARGRGPAARTAEAAPRNGMLCGEVSALAARELSAAAALPPAAPSVQAAGGSKGPAMGAAGGRGRAEVK